MNCNNEANHVAGLLLTVLGKQFDELTEHMFDILRDLVHKIGFFCSYVGIGTIGQGATQQ